MSVARFVADQRTYYRVPHSLTCALLGVSSSWFYKWLDRTPTPTQRRRAALDAAVAAAFTAARGLHGSPRLHATYTAGKFTALCSRLGIRQSMGRVGSCFDNAAAEAFFSSLEWEVLSRHEFATTAQARTTVIDWCYGFYNHQRRHSAAAGQSPINYETAALTGEAA
jgi:transposase InsO family protein